MIIKGNEVNNEIRVLLNQPCHFGSRAPSQFPTVFCRSVVQEKQAADSWRCHCVNC